VVIILISMIPIFIEILRARRDRRRAAADQAETVSPGANNAAE
jgi:hypothetical protein